MNGSRGWVNIVVTQVWERRVILVNPGLSDLLNEYQSVNHLSSRFCIVEFRDLITGPRELTLKSKEIVKKKRVLLKLNEIRGIKF